MSSTVEAPVSGPGPRGPRGIEARRRARATRRYYLLTAASTLVPGLGLMRTRRRTGLALLVVLGGGLLALLGYGLSRGLTSSAIAVGVSRTALMWVIPLVLLAAALWVYGIVRTARDNVPHGSRGAPRVAMLLFAAIACGLIIAPAAQATRYAIIQRSLLGDVFPSLPDGEDSGPGDGADPWAGIDRVNVLLVGSDAGPDREGIRPDSLMVASVDAQSGETVLFGIPRNLQNVPFSKDNPLSKHWPDGYDCGDACLMEMVWTLGEENATLFPGDPNPGLTVTKDAVSEVLGLDIDYTTVVDLRGFQSLVDAMGGVEVDVKERVCIGCRIDASGVVVGTTGYIEPGVQRLNGYRALWYSRSRAESADGDFSRMRRQRCMVGALLKQVNPMSMLARYPQLAAVMRENVAVDIPQQDLQAWAVLVQRIQHAGSIKSLPLTNKNIDVNKPSYPKIHAMVQRAIDPPAPSSTSTSSTPTSASSSTTTSPSKNTSTTFTGSGSGSSSSTTDDQLSDITATC